MKEFIYSRNAVYEVLRAKRRDVFEIQIAEGAQEKGKIEQILKLAKERKIKVTRVPRLRLDKIHENHQGVVADVSVYPYSDVIEILDAAAEPMTYAYYHRVKGGKSPKTAPTYVKEEKAPAKATGEKYTCKVCGYIYDPAQGDPDNGIAPGTAFDDLPDSWTCPVCGADKTKFDKA